jgi:threonine dehydrogenase-like Zn-dependent dehydrogenase
LSATLVQADPATGFEPGEAVTIIPYFNCGHCLACRNGKPNCCASIQVCGVHVDGGMREYLQVPEYALVHGAGLSLEQLALVEPLAIGAHGIRRAQVQEGETVVIMGAGPIGMGTMAFAKIAGARVIAIDTNTDRLNFAARHIGVANTLDARDPGLLEALRDLTSGDMASVLIDATGNQQAINNGLAYLGHGGRYVLIGLQKNDLIFSHPEFHKRETTLMSSRNATRKDFELVMTALQQGWVKPETFISKTIGFDEVPAEFPHWLHPAPGAIKLAISMDV